MDIVLKILKIIKSSQVKNFFILLIVFAILTLGITIYGFLTNNPFIYFNF